MRTLSEATPKRQTWFATAVAAAALVVVAPFVSAPATAAEPIPQDQLSALTADDYRDGIADLVESGTPYSTTLDDSGLTVYTFHFLEGDFSVTAPPPAPEPGTITPNLATGWDGGQTYISFNNTDQVAIRNGAAAALVGTIAILNPVMGLVAGVAVAVAATYVDNQGVCPGNDELWVYFSQGLDGNPSYQNVVCRPVSYPGGG